MAVLNGERMHDTMERLLPGARSAALLWQGAAVLGGAALGAGQVYGGAAPFGLALVIGCPPTIIAYSTGFFSQVDFVKVAIPWCLILLVVATLGALIYWPMIGFG